MPASPASLERHERDPAVPLGLPWAVRFRRLDVRRGAEHRQEEHRHHDHEILVALRGRYRCGINGVALAVPAGGAVIVTPGDRHLDACDAPVAFAALVIELSPAGSSLLATDAPVASRAMPSLPILGELVDRMTAASSGSDFQAALQDALATEVVVRLAEAIPREALDPLLRARVDHADFGKRLVRLFHQHRDGGLSVGAMADALEISERTLYERCQTILGGTPARLYLRHRLELAREELVAGSTVAAVAARLGFSTPFHLSAAYRRIFDRTPSSDRPSSRPR